MCQLFSQQRPDIEQFAEGFSISKVIKQMGDQQLIDSVDNLIRKENSAAVELRHATGLNKADDFLKVIHEDRLRVHHREEAVLKMLQFAVETECLDHTVMQAVAYFDTYVRNNPMIVPGLMRVIVAVCLQISIKINEHMRFTLEEIADSFDDEFSLEMLIQLESHILQLNKFRLNVATPLDYALHFVFLQSEDFSKHSFPMSPEELITLSVPILHYSMS